MTSGYANDRSIACRRDSRSTLRVLGYDAVKTGSKMAARYTGSMGEVKEDAIIQLPMGRRVCCLARCLSSPVEISGRFLIHESICC